MAAVALGMSAAAVVALMYTSVVRSKTFSVTFRVPGPRAAVLRAVPAASLSAFAVDPACGGEHCAHGRRATVVRGIACTSRGDHCSDLLLDVECGTDDERVTHLRRICTIFPMLWDCSFQLGSVHASSET